jgi:hypothetical protein
VIFKAYSSEGLGVTSAPSVTRAIKSAGLIAHLQRKEAPRVSIPREASHLETSAVQMLREGLVTPAEFDQLMRCDVKYQAENEVKSATNDMYGHCLL